jgi:Holliday junction DNA helicase RuvB
MTALHLVTDSPAAAPRAATPIESWQTALRPTGFSSYIGQREIIGNLRTAIRAAKAGRWTLDHILMSGPPGLGKTSLAQVIANELGCRLVTTSAPAITHKGELAALLTSMEANDMLFIDEIHRLAMPLQEVLYAAMEDFKVDLFTGGKGARGGKAITVSLPRFTLLGATTHAGMLTGPMLDRFGFHFQLAHYELADITAIVARSAHLLGIAIDAEGCAEIARRSRGTPRIANRLLRRVRDHAATAAEDGALVPWYQAHRAPAIVGAGMSTTVNAQLAATALDHLGVDAAGLDRADRAYLTALVAQGAPVGVEALAASLHQQRVTIEDVIEPFLLERGFIARTSRGRVATAAGLAHLGGAS